jgi:hypothetical protein
MKLGTALAIVLFAGTCYYLIKKNVSHLIAWQVVTYIVGREVFHLSNFLSVVLGIVGLYIIMQVTAQTWEGFDGVVLAEAGSDPEPTIPKSREPIHQPHVDVGTTILHAYRNLSPEQIGGMRRDTKELMALQKELMGSLSEMKPAIEQGAELLKTFSQFFGKPGQDTA